MPGKTYIKTSANTWARIKKIYLKTGGQTWTAVRKAYIKTGTGTWKKVYDTASNKVFLKNNDFPRIRLNSFRGAGSIEAPPVQMMGPSTGLANGWPLGAIGTYLYGANADDLANYVSPNGSNITYTYNWYWNLSGNQNDDVEYVVAVNSGGTGINRDLFQNNSTYLGRDDGNYFDRNFITFKVIANNSAGNFAASSPQLYIVRQRPTGTVTMVDASNASVNTQMSATITYSNFWYNKTDTAESYVEWFAVTNLTDILTTSNRVQIEYLNTFTSTGTTTKSITSYHTPLILDKYYIARITLNNSNTLPAKYAGSVINVSGFTPSSAFTLQANKVPRTTTANGAFSLTNPTKTGYFYNVADSSWRRYVSVDIGKSTGADRYEVQIEGQYVGAAGVYSFSSANWVVLRTLFQSPYTLESSRIGGTLTMPSASMPEYLNYRFTARSLNGTSESGAAYSNAGTSTSFVYVTAPSVAPSAPSISNIQTATDFLGSYITFNNSLSSNGSNTISYYTYSIDNGSNFQQTSGSSTISSTSGKIYVTAGATINLRIRATNADGLTSLSSNLLSITAAIIPGAPTSIVVKSFVSKEAVIFFTTGSNTASVQGYVEFDNFSGYDYKDNFINVSSNTAAKVSIINALYAGTTYNSALIPYSATNKGGNQGAITLGASKVLNGSDSMTVSLGTPTKSSSTRISLTWTVAAGAPTHYIAKLYNYTAGTLISTKTIAAPTTSVSFTSADGVTYSTVYYITVQPQYQYTSSVTYENFIYSSSTITSGPNLTAPTSTSISSMSRLSDTSVRAQIASAGGSGPYYQLYWSTGATVPETPAFDAASTTSTVTEDFSPSNGSTYYFYIRSSSENLGNTTIGSSPTAGTYSDYGPATSAASYTFAQPSGSVSVSPASGTAGTTLYTATPSVTSAPSSSISYLWQYFSSSVFQWLAAPNSATSPFNNTSSTYTPPSNYVSTSGGALRCQIVANNGVGTSLTTQSSTLSVAVSTVSAPTIITNSSPVNTNTSNTRNFSVTDGSWNNSPTSYSYQWKATTYVPYPPYSSTINVGTDSNLYSGISTYDGYSIYCIVTATNAGGSGTAQSNLITQSAPTASVAPSGGGVTLTPIGTQQAGTLISANVTAMSGTATITYATTIRKKTGSAPTSKTDGTEVASGTGTGNAVASHIITDSEAAGTPDQFKAFTTGTNSAGSLVVSSGTVISTPYVAIAPPGAPTISAVSGSGSVSWTAPTTGGAVASYEIEFYTASNGSGSNAAGPYYSIGIGSSPSQLPSPYGGTNANYARARVLARNAGGPSSYSAWAPSSTTYS